MLKQINEKQGKNDLEKLRHSCAHLLAEAILNLYPDAKPTIGPVIKDGFYYDFEFKKSPSAKDFPKIEKKMKELVKTWDKFKKIVLSHQEAKKLFASNPYKLELIEEISKSGEEITAYQSGKFVDLCRGGHIDDAKKLKHFELLSLAGAYWRGNEKNKMLVRIYGTCFFTAKQLDKFLWLKEEAKKRDHRRLGRELDLFVIDKNIGKGLPLLTPKGTIIRNQILEYEARLEKRAGFMAVVTPHIAKVEMYEKTGHWQHYREAMYAPFGIDGESYVLKPMNCPHHYMIYQSRQRSYKELPFRMTEAGTCYRYEKTGELAGLLRVRALTIDDSHILMAEEQIESEFRLCINMVKKMFKAFELNNFYVRLSLSDPSDAVKYISDKNIWDKAGSKLEKIVKANNLKYVKIKGEASFYGPKIDFIVQDSLGREWQMSTLQLDLFMAKRLDLTYIDKKGKEKNPIILHRGLTGSMERTLAILIEHFGGAFPLWLSPVQIDILPVSDQYEAYVEKVRKAFFDAEIRVNVNGDNRPLGAKIRESVLQKTPYMVIIGGKEVDKAKGKELFISVRTREGKNLGSLDLYKFIRDLKKQIEKIS